MATVVDPTHSPVLCLHVTDFLVEDRTRVQLGDANTNDSIPSFSSKLRDEGQQNPITFVVEDDGARRLITGGRRWAAAAYLMTKEEFFGMKLTEDSPLRVKGPGYILARDVGVLGAIDRLKQELSENINRKGFTRTEEALGIARLQKLLEEREGRAVGVSELADILKSSTGQTGMALRVAAHVNQDPKSDLSKKLLGATSIKAANDQLQTHKRLQELKTRALTIKHSDDFEKLLGYPDGLAFLKALPDESVDFVNFDPPWGVGIDDYDRHKKHESFDDSLDYAWDKVIYPMIPEIFRVLKQHTWSVVWYGSQHYQKIVTALETLSSQVKAGKGFDVNPVPHIWYKTNKGGSQNNPDIVELNQYEPFLRIRKGDPRLFKKAVGNVLCYPMDTGNDREHFAQKTEAVMSDILERYTFGAMHVIDPTYGRGMVFQAAKKLGRTFSGAEANKENRERTIRGMRGV